MASMGDDGAYAEELMEKATTTIRSLLSAAKSVGEDDVVRLSEIVTTMNEELGAVMLLAKERGDNLSEEEISLLSELETEAVAWVEEIKKKRDELKAKVASLLIDQVKLKQALLDQTSCPFIRLPKPTDHGDDNYSICDGKK